jgi:superfamily I DNA/RNA helicase
MINRLAELLLRTQPQIGRALRATYPFVFVDEFQDTTYAQYDFLLSALGHPRTVVTAVGDDKQRIMTWAGARTDAFDRFAADFGAEKIPLLFNFRSSPDLVRIQHVIAQALDIGSTPTIVQAERQVDGDVAQVWTCPTEAGEAQQIATWLSADMAGRGTKPRDYAILVRQKADQFEEQLAAPLASLGLSIRNESRALGRMTLQDLLVDTYTGIAIALLRLGANRQAPKAWQAASEAVQHLRGAAPDDDRACARAEDGLTAFLKHLRATMGRRHQAAPQPRICQTNSLPSLTRLRSPVRTGSMGLARRSRSPSKPFDFTSAPVRRELSTGPPASIASRVSAKFP